MTWVVGLDIGGSGSRIRLTNTESGEELDGAGPGVHLRENGVDVAAIVEGFAPALAQWPGVHAEAAAVGMTGLVGLTADPAPFHAVLSAAFGVRVIVLASDAVTALVGAIGLRPGAVVAAGTGVIAFGTDLDTVWRRVDGWAHLLGDDGGGVWLGMRGLNSAMRAYDGRRGGSADLLERARQRFGDPEGFPRIFYTRADRAGLLATFATDVIGSAEAGDPIAGRLVDQAGVHLGESAAAAIPPGQEPVVSYAGGLFAAGEILLGPMRHTLAALVRGARLVAPTGSPLDGAITLARTAAAHPERIPIMHPYIWTLP